MNRQERSRPFLFFCLFVCFFFLPCKINQSRSIWLRRVSVKEVCVDLHDHDSPSQFHYWVIILFCETRDFFFVVIMWYE